MSHSLFPELDIAFLGCSKDPVEILYSAHQINRSREDLLQIWQKIQEKTLSRDEMIASLPHVQGKTYATGLRQVQFIFVVDHISRITALSLSRPSSDAGRAGLICADIPLHHEHQLAVTPPSFKNSEELIQKWNQLQSEMASFYQRCLKQGIEPEDAGFAMPQGVLCREQIAMSFQAMQQFLDRNMCENSHWEIRKLSRQMYSVMKTEFPSLTKRLGIKCWENRNLFCDEPFEQYEKCRWRKTRPHKSHLHTLWKKEKLPSCEHTIM